MSEFLERTKRAIAHHGLLEDGQTVVVGLSGGADSVALLDALMRLGYSCVAAHCNYHLRGQESNRDCRSARAVAERLGSAWECRDFDVEAESLAGESVEMACRRLRYAWFDELLDRHGAAAVAVAHHQGDQTETFFLNLLRGSGLAGLRGMLPKAGRVVRPLLGFTRREIEAYLAERGLTFVVDSTNTDTKFRRNAVRHNVLPALRAISADADTAIARSQVHLAEAEQLLDALVAEKAQKYIAAEGGFNIAALAQAEPMAAALAYYMLRPQGFSRDRVDDIIAAADTSGRTFADTGGRTWLLDRGILRPYAGAAPDTADWTALISVEKLPVAAFKPARNCREAWFDAALLTCGKPITLRPWQPGDRIRPFGMAGRTQLVSDILCDAKVPRDAKSQVMVLLAGDDIIWLPGFRNSCLYPVSANSREVLRLTYKPSESRHTL